MHPKVGKKTILVTGGLGFIGSHLVDSLMNKGNVIFALDNLSNGTVKNVKQWMGNSDFHFVKTDLLGSLESISDLSFDIIFHFAANPEVRVSSIAPDVHFRQNVQATFKLLEFIRKTQSNSTFVFASTSAVYGEPDEIPTPEKYAPLKPISVYGATKLASEALITAYAHNYDFKAIICRLANIIGPRSNHGVIYDFVHKLRQNPNELEILGDGTQTKSYLYVEDCVNAILLVLNRVMDFVEIYNVGSIDKVNVKTIAKIVTEEMELKDAKLSLTGGVDGGRGWKGDVKTMLLDINRLRDLGWQPRRNSSQAVRQTAKAVISQTT